MGIKGDANYVAEVPARDPTTHSVMIESNEVKAITMINAESITGLESYNGKETVTVNKFLSCLGDLTALSAAGKGKKFLRDHTTLYQISRYFQRYRRDQVLVGLRRGYTLYGEALAQIGKHPCGQARTRTRVLFKNHHSISKDYY